MYETQNFFSYRRHCTSAQYVVSSFLESALYVFIATENLISTVDDGKGLEEGVGLLIGILAWAEGGSVEGGSEEDGGKLRSYIKIFVCGDKRGKNWRGLKEKYSAWTQTFVVKLGYTLICSFTLHNPNEMLTASKSSEIQKHRKGIKS